MKNKEYKMVSTLSELSPLSALSALKRCRNAPKIVVIAPSGSGKSTIIYLLINGKLTRYMRIGIGDKSLTTIIPSEFFLDERIRDDNEFAIRIKKKAFNSNSIHYQIVGLVLKLFADNDYDTEETIDAIDDSIISSILEPVEGKYHLNEIKDKMDFCKMKSAISVVLNALNESEFEKRYKEKKEQLRGKKTKIAEVRELVFDEIYANLGQEKKEAYIGWLDEIGSAIQDKLLKAVKEDVYSENEVELNIEEERGKNVLEELYNPFSPYSLIIESIFMACKPRAELIKIAKEKYPDFPFRVCVRDTMGMNQGMSALDINDIKDSLEASLSSDPDAVLYLMSLEEDDITLEACSRALVEKREALMRKGQLNVEFYVLFTKADRIIENLISNRRKDGELVINAKTYEENIDDALSELESMVSRYSHGLSDEREQYVSLRYIENSLIDKALENNPKSQNFKPIGIFDKFSDIAMKTLISTFPNDITKPIFVEVKEEDKAVVVINVKEDRIRDGIVATREFLCNRTDIVNQYTISDKTPRIHGRSVVNYWARLKIGLGYSTRASVYGNFAINMKGLMKRAIMEAFPSFDVFDDNQALELSADNLEDLVLEGAVKELVGNYNLEVGLNPVMGERNMYCQRLYEFFGTYFKSPEKYASVVDRVSFKLTYGDPEIEEMLKETYYRAYGYDEAIRSLQDIFYNFFASDKFSEVLSREFGLVMSEMANKLFVAI